MLVRWTKVQLPLLRQGAPTNKSLPDFFALPVAGRSPHCTILGQESLPMTGNETANMYEFSYGAIKAQANEYVLGL
jgi:hypothetical protein